MSNGNISIQPFINLLRKSGLQVPVDSAILGQQILDIGYYGSSREKLKQALKTIIVKKFEEFEIFDICFDVFFRSSESINALNKNLSEIIDTEKGESDGELNPNQSMEGSNQQRSNEFMKQFGDHRSDIASELELDAISGNIGGGVSDGINENQTIKFYTRWLPSGIRPIAYSFLSQPVNTWKPIVNNFIEIIFGFGQFSHVETIAQRYTRYASFLTRGYSQLLDELNQDENLTARIRNIEELEFLRERIIEFLRATRLNLLRNSNLDSDALLRQFYSATLMPDIKNYLQQDFKRMEGDLEKVQQHLLYLGKKIAVQEKRKRIRAQTGKINFRRTIRKNISNGGHFLNIANQKKKLQDPKIILLSDVSGSTDWISEFFFIITYAAQSTFKKLRLFEFDNTTVEITKGLKSPTLSKALQKRIDSWQNPPRTRTLHSNYHTALVDFEILSQRYFSRQTSVLLLGDCRDWLGGYKETPTGYEPESKEVLKRIIDKNKRLVILNPEAPERWDSGDSIVSHFKSAGAQVVHIENIIQLMNFIFKHKWY